MRRLLAIASLTVLAAACGDKTTEPVSYGPPVLLQVNGVTKPSGIIGMTVILEGTELAEAQYGKVYFLGTDGTEIAATTSEWANQYILAAVPQGTATESKVWVKTDWGTTDSLDFTIISGNTFSPSNISWARTEDLPQPLQGLGAVYVPVEQGDTESKYIFTIGGAATVTNLATTAVYRGAVEETGAISEWTTAANQLPVARAYHATAAATPYTSPIDTTAAAAYLYAIGGIDAAGQTVNTVHYAKVDLAGDVGAWQTTTALPAALHSAEATLYRGYLYVSGGANGQNVPQPATYRAKVNTNGTLGSWEAMPALPVATTNHAMVNFGPFVYLMGGDTAAVTPGSNTPSGKETSATYLARIDMRTGALDAWTPTTGPGKARAKHGMMTAGGSVVVTSGMYSGQAGSSENSYAQINANGTLGSWGGATGTSTIQSLLGYSLYNAAAVSFADATGKAHVIVLGGANRGVLGEASAAVIYY